MQETRTLPDLADRFRCLLNAVTGALCSERRWWGWLGGPMALLVWMRTRRMRREAAAMLEQFKALIERLLALLEEHRAGKLTAANAPQVSEVLEAEEEKRASPVAAIHHRGGRGKALRPCRAAAPCGPDPDRLAVEVPSAHPTPIGASADPSKNRDFCSPERSIPAPAQAGGGLFAEMTGVWIASVGYARSLFLNGVERCGKHCAHFVTI
jgi:hypothetical protein